MYHDNMVVDFFAYEVISPERPKSGLFFLILENIGRHAYVNSLYPRLFKASELWNLNCFLTCVENPHPDYNPSGGRHNHRLCTRQEVRRYRYDDRPAQRGSW